LSNPLTVIGNSWRKNWPEVRCGLAGGLPRFLFSKNPKPCDPGVPVFCYHVVSRDIFRDDLAFLEHNSYTTLTTEALLDHIEGRQTAPPKSVVLTFDDGHANLYGTVFPLLRKFGCKAVAFIVPALHRDESEPGDDPATGLCTWPQVREMHDSGLIDFQPHTNSHRYVPDWPRAVPLAGVDPGLVEHRRPEPTGLVEDLRGSKAELERRLDKRVRHLAFPQYNGTDQAIQTARGLGYRGFFWGVLPGRPVNRPGDPADKIVRISGEFVRRLPGLKRVPLRRLMQQRYGKRFVRSSSTG